MEMRWGCLMIAIKVAAAQSALIGRRKIVSMGTGAVNAVPIGTTGGAKPACCRAASGCHLAEACS
jgi:hypothetical protein